MVEVLKEATSVQKQVATTQEAIAAAQKDVTRTNDRIMDIHASALELQRQSKRDADRSGRWVMILTVIMALSAVGQVAAAFWQSWIANRQARHESSTRVTVSSPDSPVLGTVTPAPHISSSGP